MQKTSKIVFTSADRPTTFANKGLIKEVVKTIFKEYGLALSELTYVFCSDEYLLIINKQYLNHDDFTDIITFDLSDKPLPKAKKAVVGEIYISLDRVKENATSLKLAWQTELWRVVFHGALHLCGLKDKKKSESFAMRNEEDRFLRLMEYKIKR